MIKGSRKPMSVKLENYTPIPVCGCHIWLGSVDKDGYGTIGRADGSHLKAHRESYRFHCGEIPEGAHVLHTCDITACIAPGHLYLGDPAQNGHDKKVRGRARGEVKFGVRNPMHRLTDEDVIAIRLRFAQGETQKSIGLDYNMTQAAISKIVRRERWTHV